MSAVCEIIDENSYLPEGAAELIEAAARAALECEGALDARVCVSIVDGQTIRALNARTRNTDAETDVLSFPEISYPAGKTARDVPDKLRRAYDPACGKPFLGDIVLNIARAQQQAAEYGHSVQRETAYLTAHATFHLLGYDHMTETDKSRMRLIEKQAMKRLGIFKCGERDTEGAE
ncbi:MAG: rRNA maturation RNase YbeY [Clostridia bacterium]|nr:rRNA maturation RNase YbeY [Clostridia bacterium]